MQKISNSKNQECVLSLFKNLLIFLIFYHFANTTPKTTEVRTLNNPVFSNKFVPWTTDLTNLQKLLNLWLLY